MPEKTIVLNATTIKKGGTIPAVVSFICEVINQFQCHGGARWIFAVSGEVRDQLADFGHAVRDGVDLCLEHSPARNRRSRRNLRDFVGQHADLVFTFYGPAYVAFRCPHICGVADGWVTHSSKLAYSILPTSNEKLRMALLSVYKGLWLRRADYWVVDHEAARAGLINRLRLPAANIYLVSGNCGQAYLDEKPAEQPKALQSTIRILTFAANFPHKCLELIPQIAAQLVRQHHIGNVQFILTVPTEEYAQSTILKLACTLGIEHYISNVGYVALKDGPALYRGCDIVLLPSVLETFSSTYPESMRMGLPIVTSDLEFARTICRDAALYFKPLDAAGAAGILAMLIRRNDMRARLVAAGFNRARDFPSPMEKYRQLKSIIDEILVKCRPTMTD